VRDHDQRLAESLEVPLEPLDGLEVQVVGRLVQEQDFGLLEQQLGQQRPRPLPAA
jgi:hypothetical protein